MKFFIVITLMFLIVLHDGTYCSGEELKRGDEIRDCYGVSCPEGAVSCTKHSTTTDNLKYINSVVKCLDNQGNTLKSDHQQSANPFPEIRFSIFSFEGGVVGTLGRQKSDIPLYDNKNDEVETFQ